jgi:hypothetical protein
VGGPEAGAGLVRGDWEFAHTGALVVAEEVLKGHDLVILATPTGEFANSFIMTRKEITELAQLSGKKVGVLTETGQTSVTARLTIEKAGAKANLCTAGQIRSHLRRARGGRDRCRGAADRPSLQRGGALRLACLSAGRVRHARDFRDHPPIDRL